MKTKIYSLLFFCACMLTIQQTNAQCSGRYHDMIFQNVTVTTDTYSTSNSTLLRVDVYQPTGDNLAQRPLIIMAHGGSFIGGDRTNDNVCTTICTNFAKRGYVCASIDYRLGQALQMLDSANAITTVMRAISDGKSAIRFFRKDAATTNKYHIDPTKIFAGGNSAGAVLYAHCAFIDSLNEAPTPLRSIITANGGLEGNSGNDGYSSEMVALINLAGGLNVPEFVGPGNKPSFNAQGDADATVPYMCANAQSGLTPVRLCGLGAMKPLYDQFSLNYYAIIYPGEGHVPWASNASEMTQIDTTSANFLLQFVCSTTSGINDVKQATQLLVYPNPASSEVNIQASAKVAYVSMYDNIGQLVAQSNLENTTGTINTSNFVKGIYHIKIEFADKDIATVTRKVVIE